MMIPQECKMPDLSDLEFPLKRHLMFTAVVGDGPITERQASYRRNFVRLVDKAISEYQAARESILLEIEKGADGSFYILGFTDHFENCINALCRLVRQLRRLITGTSGWEVTREKRTAIDAHAKAVFPIRNAGEHMEEDIKNDKIEKGQPLGLCIGGTGDRAVLAGHEIRFTDVAAAIRAIHGVARDLFPYK